MDPFRGRAPRYLTALRQFRARVPIQSSSAAFGMTNYKSQILPNASASASLRLTLRAGTSIVTR
jgi:hypothetical protein